jgi:lactose/cellobiose-specific phosphotransferase system IIC component
MSGVARSEGRMFGKALIDASQWRPLIAIRSGFVTLLPLLIIQGVAIALASTSATLMVDGKDLPPLVEFLYAVHTFIISIIPTLAVITIAYHASDLYGCNRGYTTALTLLIYLIMVYGVGGADVRLVGDVSLANNVFSLLLGPMVPWMFGRVASVERLHLFRGGHYNPAIRRMLNYTLPTILILALFIVAGTVLWTMVVPAMRDWMPAPDATRVDSLPALLAGELAINALWSIGVHGSVALSPWVQALHESGAANLIAAQQGRTMPHLGTDVFFDAFVHMGGSGMTMALILSLLLFSRSRNKRLIAYSALPISLFNVNEIVLYGLPVIFNRHLLLPFVSAPLLATLTTYVALDAGWVPVPTQATGWTTPPLLGAFLSTGGDWSAVALAAFNLALGIVLYRPFILRWEREQSTLDMRILEFRERMSAEGSGENLVLEDERPTRLQSAPGEDEELSRILRDLRDGSLELHYQPIFELRSGKPVAVEALLRLQDPRLGLRPPTFLPALHAAGLMQEVDRWVVERLLQDWREWNVGERALPELHINISPESLLQPHLIDRLVEAGRLLPLVIEVVENQLPGDTERVIEAVKKLQRAGVKVAIDDFGVGHSSLSRLSQLGISQIKIDKSLLDGVDRDQAGSQLFIGVVALARRLQLTICVEGVERLDQLAFLIEQGVDDIQGFIAGKPMPWAQMRTVFLRDRSLLELMPRPAGDTH